MQLSKPGRCSHFIGRHRPLLATVLRFLVSGTINTSATLVMYWILMQFVHYQWAYLASYCAGILLSYALSTRYVFQTKHSWFKFALFPLVYLTTYFVGALVLKVAVDHLGVIKGIAPLASIAATLPVSFLLTRTLLQFRALPKPKITMLTSTGSPQQLPQRGTANDHGFQFRSLRKICRDDWGTLCFGGLLSLLLASILLSGWPAGLIPEIKIPYAYSGDALSSAWLTQRAIEGWVFHNERSGFPFGSSFLDYPGSDSASFLILKILGLLTGSGAGAMNLFFLLSFPVNFFAAHIVIRSLRVGKALSIAAAVLFAFAPFHFLRLGHLFYTWYFVAPLYFYLGLQIALKGKQLDFNSASWSRRALLAACYLIMSCFGVYYTAFGMLVIAAASLIALFTRNYQAIRFIAAPAVFFLAIGTAANIAPNVLNEHQLGHNPEVANRSAAESEIYGTKPLQLILPRPGHRSEFLSSITAKYNATTPLVNENSTASLGIFGTAGLAIMMLVALAGIAGVHIDRRLSALALMSVVLLAFMTIGGLGSLFAHLVSPSIRGWNRASIFISFSTLAALVLTLQIFAERIPKQWESMVTFSLAFIMVSAGLWDQTVPACTGCNAAVREEYEQDRDFITKVERALPPGAALYQLPYMGFPESPPINNLSAYGLTTGFIHSRSLKWSFAGIRGREGDLFFRGISSLPVPQQLEAIQDKGFDAVYIDTRGYADEGTEVISNWTAALGHGPILQRNDGKVVIFSLKDIPTAGSGTSFEKSTISNSEAPLLLSQWQSYLRDGWSVVETWGVWSEGSSSTLHLPLPPEGVSLLRLQFNAFAPNGHTLTVTASISGGKPVKMAIGPDGTTGLTIDVPLPENTRSYPLIVSLSYDKPISPLDAGISQDPRVIAVGLTSLRWVKP